MALILETIQPVILDGKKCVPAVNPEQRLRLQTLGEIKTEEDYKKASEIISKCFPKEESYVAEKVFKLTPFDINSLKTYLVSGKSGIDEVARQTDRRVDKYIENEAKNG